MSMSSINGASMGGASGLHQVMALRREVLSRNTALQEVRVQTGAASPGVGPSVGPSAALGGPAAPMGSFADTLTGALQNVSAVQNKSANMQAAYERGEVTDIAKVMLARQEAGVAFEATLQVRNKLLSAYQDIMRMGS